MDGSSNKMIDVIEGLPVHISESWVGEYDLFAEGLLRGEFKIDVTDHYVMEYLFHYSFDFAEQDEEIGLNDCLDLFDVDATPPSEAHVKEMHDLLVAISIAEPIIKALSKNVKYTGNLPQYMKYIA